MVFTFQTGTSSIFSFRMKNMSGCSHVGFSASFIMCLLKKAKKRFLSISAHLCPCTCCSLNCKDHSDEYYFEEVSPELPARAGPLPGHHHLMWQVILRVFWDNGCLVWNLSQKMCVSNRRDGGGWALRQGPCYLNTEVATDDHPQSRCRANPIFTGLQTLPLDVCKEVVKCSDYLGNKNLVMEKIIGQKVCSWAGETSALILSLHARCWHGFMVHYYLPQLYMLGEVNQLSASLEITYCFSLSCYQPFFSTSSYLLEVVHQPCIEHAAAASYICSTSEGRDGALLPHF